MLQPEINGPCRTRVEADGQLLGVSIRLCPCGRAGVSGCLTRVSPLRHFDVLVKPTLCSHHKPLLWDLAGTEDPLVAFKERDVNQPQATKRGKSGLMRGFDGRRGFAMETSCQVRESSLERRHWAVSQSLSKGVSRCEQMCAGGNCTPEGQ